jgi:leukotriene-A4 hydrolase
MTGSSAGEGGIMTQGLMAARFHAAGPAVALALLTGCAPAPVVEVALPPQQAHALPPDVHSFARPLEAAVRHVALDLVADFAAERLAGTATLDIERSAGASELVLDTRDLEVRAVTDATGRPLAFRLGAEDPVLGAPLVVTLPAVGNRVVVHYATGPAAAAVQWLRPEQTAGGRHPYLFTQGQAILTRTWVPTQDSPGIRQTYSARIVVPRGLRAVMSAEMLTPDGTPVEHGTAFEFRMPQPIPAYLMALAVGDIAFRALGPRTGVYAEPSIVDAAAHEFADMERMLEAAERLYGAYRWGRYDVLVLPPSFPFGGMENPRLTFATPTILAGDRSLVTLIAHELAHSWSGNLVTNATWDDFWLNEGFTVYFERRIMEALYGAEYAGMLNHLGRQDLLATIDELGADSPDTRLKLDLRGRDPDEGLTDIAYEKGAAFLQTVETTVGRARLDAFLRSYFDRHAFQPMTSERFLAELGRGLLNDPAEAARVRPDEWVYGTGLPANAVPAHADRFERAASAARRFADGAAATSLAVSEWTTHEWLHFLRSLPPALPRERLTALDRQFGLTESGNSEILFAWLRIAIRNRYEPAFGALEHFLTSQGRRKFVRPLYQDLVLTDWGRDLAVRIYRQARPTYHAISVASVDEIVGANP